MSPQSTPQSTPLPGPGAGPSGGNELVAVAENEDAAPLFSMEGAGLLSSIADVDAALAQGDGTGATLAGVGAGLEGLGVLVNPFGSALAAGVGWLIEHIWFLHEPLDALAGDPVQIKAAAATWTNIATELRGVAQDYRRHAPDVVAWDGAAAAAFRTAVARYGTELDDTAARLDRMAGVIRSTGAMVGTVRALLRDLIAEFVGKAVSYLVGVLLGLTTGPGALFILTGALIGITVDALTLLAAMGRHLRTVLTMMDNAGGLLADLSAGLRHTATTAASAATGAQAAARPLDELAGQVPLAESIEAGKQHHAVQPAPLAQPGGPGPPAPAGPGGPAVPVPSGPVSR